MKDKNIEIYRNTVTSRTHLSRGLKLNLLEKQHVASTEWQIFEKEDLARILNIVKKVNIDTPFNERKRRKGNDN